MGFSAGVASLELLLKFLSCNSLTIKRALSHIKSDPFYYYDDNTLPDSPILLPGLTLAREIDEIILPQIIPYEYRGRLILKTSLIPIVVLFLYGGYKGIKSGINAFQKGFRYKKFVTEEYENATQIKVVIENAQSALNNLG